MLGSASTDSPRPDRPGADRRRRARRRGRHAAGRPPDGAPAGPDPGRPIRLLPGPQYDAAALAALCAGSFTVGVGDRIGVRLDGPPVPGGEILSESPPLGALQVTPAGVPIILLADRLRTAGYTKPALVHPDDIGRVAQLRAGDPVVVRRPARAGARLVPRPHVDGGQPVRADAGDDGARTAHSTALVRHHAHHALITKPSSAVR